ncbi:MAG: hypothetical protein NTZ84_03455 [Candidatus Nealsonbacteria bacterium]|nr:hypothetical protein [Candidatus Nealsonbacteria bacterium]
MLAKHSIIRTIYLYLFTIVGLALVVSGMVRLLDMGLKMFVFTKAEDIDKLQQQYNLPYYSSPIPVEKLQTYQDSTTTELTIEERAALKSWLSEYKKAQEAAGKIDYLASQRQREASSNLAMILVGLPLYLYHWRIIKKETKEEKED